MKYFTALFIGLIANTQAIVINNRDNTKYYLAGDQGMTPNGVEYVRTLPEQYNDESENQFMCQIMTNYALEEKNDAGKPSGTFKMGEKETKSAAK